MTLDTWVAVTTIAGFGLTILTVLRQGFRSIESRVDRLEQRVDRLEQRVDRLEQRVDRLDEKIDQRFDMLSAQLYELNTRVTAALALPSALGS